MKTQAVLSILTFLLLLSCKKEEVYTPNLKGSIIGSAFLYDEFGIMQFDNNGIKITAEGYEKYTGSTDYYGRFELKDIPTGTYVVTAEKEGFGKLKKYGVKHLGGTPTSMVSTANYGRESFALIPKTTLKVFDVTFVKDSIYFKVDLPANAKLTYFLLHFYYSTSPDVKTTLNRFSDVQYASHINGNIFRGLWQNSLGFPSGTKLYAKACVEITPLNTLTSYTGSYFTSYEDPETHQIIIPSLGDASSEFTFIVPE